MLRIAPPGGMLPPQPEEPANADPQTAGQDSPTDIDQDELGLPKLDPTLSGYLPPEKGPFKCANCIYFEAPGACHIVSGDIAPDGCCNLFTSKSNGPEAESPEEDAQGPVEEGTPDVQGLNSQSIV